MSSRIQRNPSLQTWRRISQTIRRKGVCKFMKSQTYDDPRKDDQSSYYIACY